MDRCKDVDVYNPRAIKRMHVVSQDAAVAAVNNFFP